jgi:hypothetical protein
MLVKKEESHPCELRIPTRLEAAWLRKSEEMRLVSLVQGKAGRGWGWGLGDGDIGLLISRSPDAYYKELDAVPALVHPLLF